MVMNSGGWGVRGVHTDDDGRVLRMNSGGSGVFPCPERGTWLVSCACVLNEAPGWCHVRVSCPDRWPLPSSRRPSCCTPPAAPAYPWRSCPSGRSLRHSALTTCYCCLHPVRVLPACHQSPCSTDAMIHISLFIIDI